LRTADEYVQGIRAGDRVLLAQAITLVESRRPEHAALAREVIGQLAGTPSHSLRLAITGAPGAGKSTFIEALGMHLVGQGVKVAVLAIDPSSAVSGGSILGDKTRMDQLSAAPLAFIRPSPAGTSLGGVARHTRETILLVEAAGYDVVLIETVGVGQSEIAARRMSDLFLLLLLPGAGDELQGIKRGIVEMADLLVVNKADGDRVRLANQARAHYLNAVHLFPPRPSGQEVPVLACSALEQQGVAEVWAAVERWRVATQNSGFWANQRREQARYWLADALDEGLRQWLYDAPGVREQLAALEAAVLAGEVSPFAAADDLLAFRLKNTPSAI
jgi:LAO/AO transport system kinase